MYILLLRKYPNAETIYIYIQTIEYIICTYYNLGKALNNNTFTIYILELKKLWIILMEN